MSNSPVFICGLDRSGKTYMRFMLDAHPSFAITKRTNLWTSFYNRFGSLEKDENLDRCLKTLAAQKHIRALGPDFQRIRQNFEAGTRSYERLFSLIHEQYSIRLGTLRWGDQSEMLEKHAGRIFASYPDANIIHMIRDPRDRHEAIIKKSHRRGGVGATTARWLYSAALAEQNRKTYLGHYKVVRYETMVTYPEETMYRVCEFLNESYYPPMIKMEDVPRFSKTITDVDDDIPSPLTTAYIGRFRNNLSAHEIVFIQKLSSRYMQLFNYPPEQVNFSLLENARFYSVHWLVNFLFMFGWRLHNRTVR